MTPYPKPPAEFYYVILPLWKVEKRQSRKQVLYRWKAAANIAKLWVDTTKSWPLKDKSTKCRLSLRDDSIHLQQQNKADSLGRSTICN